MSSLTLGSGSAAPVPACGVLGGGVGGVFLDTDGEEDFELLEDDDVLKPKEWILRVISLDALSTTPGVLTLILAGLRSCRGYCSSPSPPDKAKPSHVQRCARHWCIGCNKVLKELDLW